MKRNRPNYISADLMVAVLLIAVAVLAVVLAEHYFQRWVAAGLLFFVAIVYFALRMWGKQRMEYVAAQLFEKNAEKIDRYVNATTMPTAITRKNGRICWCNPSFSMLAGVQCDGRKVLRVFPELDVPAKDKKVEIGERAYVKEVIYTSLNDREYRIYRLIDKERSVEVKELTRLTMPVACHIQIDNFSDMLRAAPQYLHLEIESEIERVISKHTEAIRALYQRYERESYIVVFERRQLGGLIQTKFKLLEEVRAINTGVAAFSPTLSMGLGAAGNPAGANANARKALEMALARGGDQAVLKDEDGFRYFGGIQRGRETRSRVKTRMFAKALRNLMEQCDRVLIMGHSVPDLDCMGTALGLLACARLVGRKAHIVLDEPNIFISALVNEMEQDVDYRGVFVTPGEADPMVDAHAMLIIVDTQIAKFTIAPWLYAKAKTTVVIDHHVRGTDYIEKATLFLHETYASSTSEMVTEIVQYFSDRIELKPLEVEGLLAGITMDTKGFSFKTGVRTFEAASYLRRMGADSTKIRHLFQDDLPTYTARAKVVEQAEVLEGGIAISVCPSDLANSQLLAAQAADALINIRGIGASFVLCAQGSLVMISGRSLGEVNVQRVLEKMGGGGHATIAGAQVRGMSVAEVTEMLKEKIAEYNREVH